MERLISQRQFDSRLNLVRKICSESFREKFHEMLVDKKQPILFTGIVRSRFDGF